MRNPLAAHPPWRQLTIISIVLPLMIVLAALAFAWPAARMAPRDLPVGIVGTAPAIQQIRQGLDRSEPGGFDVRPYASQASARTAIEDRDIYGAFVASPGRITVLEASAASPAVAQVLTGAGQQLAQHASVQASDVDVVPTPAGDPRGLVLPAALLPLTICSIIMASIVALLLEFRPAWRQIGALAVISATAGLGAYLIAQGFLGALPHEHLATWGALSLTVLSIGATAAGLIDLIGAPGLALSAILMIFIGNPFSGATSAPQLLPTAVDHIGQWLPPGAAASLLRSTAYFNGHGASGPLAILILWCVLGMAAIVAGHHAPVQFAARRRLAASVAAAESAEPAGLVGPAGPTGTVAADDALVRGANT